MSFTKVAPAGIGTEPGSTIRLGDSLLHSTGLDVGTGTGVGVTIRQHGDATFSGIITASAFFGDGSGLEGVSSSGIGTALNDDDTNVLNKIYYVNQELSIGSTVTVNHPDTGTASYTHYQDLVVKDDADFIVADGDTFIPDILGITTSTLAASAATGGRIRAGTLTNAGANGAPNFPNGLTGTAGTFSGVISAASATISGAISAASATITGNLGVGGVLTYEDVTNIDSVGVITARDGLRVTGIATISGDVSIADKIIHTGDTNTAIRFPGADQFSIETAGSQRLLTRADGRIQITSGNFEVIGGEGASAQLRLTADEGDDGADYWRFESNHSTNKLNIATYASGSWVDKFNFDTSGNLEVVDGNLVIGTSGHGIDFSATANATIMSEGYNTTAPTMDNELLKSYERGTWTGNIRGYDHAGGAGWGNVATTAGTNSATGRYIKIGNLVHAFIRFTGITWDTSWTYFSIVGVPFGHNHYDGAGGFCLAHDTNFFTDTGMTVMGNVWGSAGNLVGQKPTGTTNLTLDTSNSNRQLYATMIFYTSTGG